MRLLLVTLLLLVTTMLVQAQNPANWTVELEKGADNNYVIVATATIQDGWYVYSQYLESDNGPIATELVLEDENTKLVGKAMEDGNQIKGYDDMFAMDITKYKKKMVIRQPITAEKGATIKGYLTYMSCNETSCMPPQDVEFEWKAK